MRPLANALAGALPCHISFSCRRAKIGHDGHLTLGRDIMKKAIAEFIGTFALVLIGCGAAVIGGMGSGATSIDILGIAAAFGLTIVAMAYGIGQVSGCHVNPAVSFGVLVAGRMTTSDFIAYVIAQVLGAIAGAAVLYLILSGKASGWSGSLGQNGWGRAILASTTPHRHSSTK
jgi:aquaporin Z